MNQPDSKAANAAKPHGDLKTLPMAEVERQLASTPNGLTDVVTVYRPGFTEKYWLGSGDNASWHRPAAENLGKNHIPPAIDGKQLR